KSQAADGGRREDEVVLQCIATIHKEQSKFCFAAEGLGNRLCCLQPTSEAKYIPPDLCVCNFVPEQSVSVRALQEMLANTGENGGEGAAQGGGHRTLLYGHAILLRHSFSGMYLTSIWKIKLIPGVSKIYKEKLKYKYENTIYVYTQVCVCVYLCVCVCVCVCVYWDDFSKVNPKLKIINKT
uniref:Inositol 1,4,5-trisphosphate/ryanodine receptor domain-containing protein n=1 Tax=Aotus nancymaae TaxID=37293 RepID=A0A2K5BWE5_AOTNA